MKFFYSIPQNLTKIVENRIFGKIKKATKLIYNIYKFIELYFIFIIVFLFANNIIIIKSVSYEHININITNRLSDYLF